MTEEEAFRNLQSIAGAAGFHLAWNTVLTGIGRRNERIATLTAEVARLKEREAELQDLIEAMWVFADAKHTYTDAFKARIAKAITPMRDGEG